MNVPKTRIENIVVQEMENEILIYDLKENKAFCLNETSSLIYQLCDGKNSIAEITEKLSKKLRKLISEEMIWLALNDFKRDGLLENNEQFEIDFKGLSRRQVIKKVGLASMVALPIVASVIAPNAVNAASGAANLALCVMCNSPSQCASDFCETSNGSNTCSPPGTIVGNPPGPIFAGSCPSNSAFCLANCREACCSGSVSFSGGFCVCNPVP